MRSLPPTPMSTITLNAILNGALGNDMQGTPYAWKANQLYRYNYSKAMNRGSANLNLILDRDIRNVNMDSSLDQYRKMQALKGTVDTLYTSLERYKTLDNPVADQQRGSRSLPMIPTLTFQSILNGALGEPYTAKAKEVYNMGEASYVDVFVEKINEVINSSYPTELTKINAAKSVVDTIYNFLGSHLKGRQSTSPAPVPALTFQSILDGALGNDYASKLKEMYNQMVAPMTRMLKPSDLDPVLNASYPSELAKITAVKSFIDKMYNS